MEKRSKPENQHQQQDREKEKNAAFVIRIPSYEEVSESSQPKTTSQSLFNPSPSFSQAFNFIKNSEFYATPPAPSPSPSLPSEVSPSPSSTPPPRQSEGPSTSVSSAGGNRNSILVSHRQKGNPLLKHIRNVRWAFADIACDYLLGQNTCALYLSLRYHLLHPDYLYFRIRELQKNFKLRVVLCHVDVEDVVKPLLEVTKTALLHDCTLLCGWSFKDLQNCETACDSSVLLFVFADWDLEECGRYLETIKVYENKPADLIQGQMDMDYLSRLSHALTAVRHVNKTDVVTLGSTFGSLSHIMDASMEDLARCPGIGERKNGAILSTSNDKILCTPTPNRVKRLHDIFHEPFKRAVSSNPVPTGEKPVDESENEKNGGEKEIVEGNKRQKKEAEVSVKSALKAAFAKYSDRIGSKRNKLVPDKIDDDQRVDNNSESAS
ncbi:hypothetical protein CASFOL_000274 [Castilleja foliolosa]|uniref:DNA excision repair protein ERCC-1 n=1 Tax=Castilleja foliolosa TaxID=1961234 RepID=A0ABD3ENH5_9LAMI